MAVRVDLSADGRIVEIVANGVVTRRETGWAVERAREVAREKGLRCLLADCLQVEPQASPTLTSELLENSVFAFDPHIRVAYVYSGRWTPDYRDTVLDSLTDVLPGNVRTFDTRATALDWLGDYCGSAA
ncbi:MAG: hypothetical protein NXI03_03910 [Alphaproteobacteria bacterium]|uniref:hypothetical protein n=1 Tax=Maricaulis alexandrii TaxID=2570354 RepID=UPI00110892CB|nr:hypothetical protein [Maricaulis alexandrii]MCR9266693.1 hypothetical protein [Alphaproteobacteria bacterium]